MMITQYPPSPTGLMETATVNMPTQRYFMVLSYLGTRYQGWQKQPGRDAPTIQQQVERALAQLGHSVPVLGAGRTDTGVHAAQQVAHLDLPLDLRIDKLPYQLNAVLPKDIRVTQLLAVLPDSHARFHAIRRTYRYTLYHQPNPFLADRAWYYPHALDRASMQTAATQLIGTHDFQALAKRCPHLHHHRCTVTRAQWQQNGDTLTFEIAANRFLHHMVRMIVGQLVEVGRQRVTVEAFGQLLRSGLHSKETAKAQMAPAHGLCFTEVHYPTARFLARLDGLCD